MMLEVKVDPDISLVRPHLTFEQGDHFLFSLAKGDEDTRRVPVETARQVAGKLPPSGS